MACLKFFFYLNYLFLWITAEVTDVKMSVQQKGGFLSRNVGEKVTLKCFYQGNAVMFFWYKQTLGQKLRLISTLYKFDKVGTFTDEFINDSRFSLEIDSSIYHLTISDLRISDSSTYYCASCKAYKFEFGEGVTVSVKVSDLTIPAVVHKSLSGTVHPEGSVNCAVHTGTCDGKHSVYWFTDYEVSNLGVIYTSGDRNDQCEKKNQTKTNTCIYKLPNNSLNVSNAGTYNCAVALCGHILFGSRTKLDLQDDMDSFVLVYFLTGALVFTIILIVLLTFSVNKIYKTTGCKCADSQAGFSTPFTVNVEVDQDVDNIHYAALRKQRISGEKKQNEETHCVYSTVKK